MSIFNLLNQIKNDEVVLPAIQRDFVWPVERIYKLLDSIMRGYPIGIVLLWETYEDIQYRSFVSDYKPGNLHSYRDNTQRKRIKLVLDGQQRLQSLFIALYGTLDSFFLYFDVLSGRESDDVSEEKFNFTFAPPDAIEEWNVHVKEEMAKSPDKREKNIDYCCFVKASDLYAKGALEKEELKEKISTELSLPKEDKTRLNVNFARFDEVFSRDENILKVSTIDENLPSESPYRKSDADVLEVFVRVNTEGTPLSRSDLIFSMLKLNWKESATILPEFVQSINEGNSFGINNDFVIRCLFAVSDLGTKFDINLLRKKSNAAKLRANFEKCCHAIQATVDFVQRECWCSSGAVIGGLNTLIPFVYYLFHTKNHQVRNDQVANVRKGIYLIGFSRPFSRYAESRAWAFIRDELRPLIMDRNEAFPWENLFWWVNYWERIRSFDDLLQANHVLALHLVQHLSGAAVKYERNTPEVDHIFPRSILRAKGFDPSLINNYANFWILAKSKNQNKSNQHPRIYFKDVDASEMKAALIDKKYLDFRRFTTFISNRRQRIIKTVNEKLGFRGDEFEKYSGEEN